MKKYIGIWMVLFLVHCSDSLNIPEKKFNGCNRQKNDETCKYDVYCFNSINEEMDTYSKNSYRRRQHYYPDPDCCTISMENYYNYYCLDVKYKTLADEALLPNGNDQILLLIYNLDLSSNEYNVMPNLKAMNNLHSLDMSKNYLKTAKLYNIYELPQLEGLDLSYNKINTIEVSHSNVYRKLRILNLAHNDLIILPNAILGDFTELITLDLSHNFLTALGVASFEGLKKLKTLNLSHNRITEINGALFRFDKLQKLDFSHNKLSEVKFHDFENLQELTNLNFSDNSIVSIESLAFSNMHLLNSLKLDRNNLEDLSKIKFSNNSNLEDVDISQNNLKVLPRNAFKGRSIQVFNVKGNLLEGILSKGSFEGLGRVTSLDLSYQQLTGLEDNAFSGLESLHELLLHKNKLETISNKTFINLTELTMLDLSDNKIANLNFDTTGFSKLELLLLRNNLITQLNHEILQGLHALHILDLSRNQISELVPKTFDSLRELINLNISGNPLNGSLETATFDGLVSLPRLDISDTELTIVKNGSFMGISELKIINISRNKLVELQFNSFSGISKVEIIDISYNQLKTLEINWKDLVNLKEILLSHNLLKAISCNTFVGLNDLSKLDLSHNNLKSIHERAFENVRHLVDLDISYNTDMTFNVSFINQNIQLKVINLSGLRCDIKFKNINDSSISKLDLSNSSITDISSLVLKTLINVEFIVLSHNHLEEIEFDAFSNLKHIEKIDLSFNNLRLIQPGAFNDIEHLQILNISHNNLTTISYGALRGLLNLNTLDISYNNIKVIDSERFYEVPSIEVLILDNNNIDFISAEEFAGSSLSVLSIGGNFIPCEILVNFMKKVSYKISAIHKYEKNKENVDGISCTAEISYKTYQSQDKEQNEDNILIDIRNTLLKIESKSVNPTQSIDAHSHLLSNISQEVQKLTKHYDEKLSTLINLNSQLINQRANKTDPGFIIKESVNKTNDLLEKILVSLNKETVPGNISNFNDFVHYIDNVRNEIESNIYRKIDNLERKIATTDSNVEISKSLQEKALAHQLMSTNDNSVAETKPALFTNICLGLILFTMVSFILYKFYKSRTYLRRGRSSYSTRELPTSMETPEL